MQRAVATYTGRAVEKLRRFGLVASALSIAITTKRYGAGPHYEPAATARLEWPTYDTQDLVAAAAELLERIWG